MLFRIAIKLFRKFKNKFSFATSGRRGREFQVRVPFRGRPGGPAQLLGLPAGPESV